MKIAMIMLAAGNSRRFGANKLLYEIDGIPMYRHVLEQLDDTKKKIENIYSEYSDITEDNNNDNNSDIVQLNNLYRNNITAKIICNIIVITQYDAIAEAVIKNVMKAGKDCLADPENYEARANMMWASSLAHNGLTQCGREFQLVVHQLEHEVSGMYPEVAHGAGLAALWCSWARYVYKANINRWLQYASNVWGLDIDFEHPEKTIETAIDMQEQYYASIGMPIGLKELGVKEEDLAKLALDCSRNKTRSLIGYKPLAYEDILVIYQMAYERG